MDRSSTRAEEVRAEIAALRNRYRIVHRSQRCERCRRPLTLNTQAFYLFPCKHCFHIECLTAMVRARIWLVERDCIVGKQMSGPKTDEHAPPSRPHLFSPQRHIRAVNWLNNHKSEFTSPHRHIAARLHHALPRAYPQLLWHAPPSIPSYRARPGMRTCTRSY